MTLIIEVADSTLSTDRSTKARLYARAQIPSYWIINLVDRRIEMHSAPSDDEAPIYRNITKAGSGEQIPLVIDEQTVAMLVVDDLLP